MKYKHESTIRIIPLFALVLIMFLLRKSSTSLQIFIGSVTCIGAILCGIYFARKISKIGAALMFGLALMIFLVVLGQYFDSYNLAMLIPAMFIILLMFSYKIVVMAGDKDQIRKIRVTTIIGVVICSIIQIVMIIPLFIKIR